MQYIIDFRHVHNYIKRSNICTFFIDDIHRLKQGLASQYYDAFLLYAEEDIVFVKEMIEKLEIQFKLKVRIANK